MKSRFALLAFAAATAIGFGCSSSSSSSAGPDCHTDTSQCRAGTTCWPVSGSGPSIAFACLKSNPLYGFGATCQDQAGTATCGDGLTCDATSATGMGVCTYYCGGPSNLPCPVGYSCHTTRVGGSSGPVIELCRQGASSSSSGGSSGSSGGTVPPGYLPDGGFDPSYDGGAGDGGPRPQ